MSQEQATDRPENRRLGQRETHSGRAAASIATAVLLLLAVVWLGVELVLSATGNSALLVSPVKLLGRAASLPSEAAPSGLVMAGAILALLGLVYVAAAVLPGTKPRHILANPRSAVVVDNEVLAAAVSKTARLAARLAPEQVTSSVGHKRIDVVVRPVSGHAVDRVAIIDAVEREVSGYGLDRPLSVAVATSPHGLVGA